MTIAVVGANGVYARHLLPRLAEAGFETRAVVRRPEAAGPAESCGMQVRLADIFDRAQLELALEDCDVCINLATSLPGPSGRGDFAVNDKVRSEGVPILIQACKAAGVAKILQQSIAMVGAAGDVIADETFVCETGGDDIASRAIRATLAMEQSIVESGLDWLILRGGLFYGPGTGFDDEWFSRAASGKLRLPGDGSGYVSLVHIADMASATVAALKNWPSNRKLIITDDHPARWSEVFGYISGLCSSNEPAEGGRQGFPSFRMSNAAARSALDWRPHYASYISGLAR